MYNIYESLRLCAFASNVLTQPKHDHCCRNKINNYGSCAIVIFRQSLSKQQHDQSNTRKNAAIQSESTTAIHQQFDASYDTQNPRNQFQNQHMHQGQRHMIFQTGFGEMFL